MLELIFFHLKLFIIIINCLEHSAAVKEFRNLDYYENLEDILL